ncbi:kinase-like domain-containing protein [Suillus clintonianus]|uniref:kinase-like domain-containing protein n=1 Tax=Suillus clintonianus TaxID=1904413 RepID=UPI001B868D7A|nr:kinase-like domain-containing protein [Suillus clintonianus]KAG2143615.1 kinase-like domain-containing protein [Suillus clintonianus]
MPTTSAPINTPVYTVPSLDSRPQRTVRRRASGTESVTSTRTSEVELSSPPEHPLTHLPNSDAARRRNTTIDWVRTQTRGEPPGWTARQPSRGGRWTESSTITHAGTSRIQPADMRPPSDTQRQHYDPGLQSLPQDSLYAHGGPAPDLPGPPTLPVVALPPPSRIPSPVLGSRLPESPPHPYEVLTPSFDTDIVLPIRNHESGDFPPEARLQNLTEYITKDGDYPVARGGFGEIWKCTYHNDQTSIKVAVKALQVYAADHLGAAKTKKIKRIKRELRICANLKHRNILPVYGYTYGFGPFIAIVIPWAENGNLTAYLEREGAALALVRRFQILRDIIAGLRYLHANSVIHGDFNGPNVLIHGDGSACVADFGLSLMYSEVISASQASWTSTLKGNMRWMAPELLVDREDGSQVRPSEHSDMYSFGGVILQVLTNKIPYYHLSNDAAIVLCIAKSETPSRSRYPVLPDKYWEFIEQCWSTDPRDRPSTQGANRMIRNEYHALSRSP